MRHIAVGVNLTGTAPCFEDGPGADPCRGRKLTGARPRGRNSGADPSDPRDPGTAGRSRNPLTRGDQRKAPLTVLRPIDAMEYRCLPATKGVGETFNSCRSFPDGVRSPRANTRLPHHRDSRQRTTFPTITCSIHIQAVCHTSQCPMTGPHVGMIVPVQAHRSGRVVRIKNLAALRVPSRRRSVTKSVDGFWVRANGTF
jgi:hypothetical protein